GAAYTLGKIRQEKNDPAQAIGFFDAAVGAKADSATAALARVGRAQCKLATGDDEAATGDFRAAVEIAKGGSAAMKEQAVAALEVAAAALGAKGNYQAASELLLYEPALEAHLPPGHYARLAVIYEKRAEQVEQSLADA